MPELLVIDGQQRLTTISLIIAAIADYLKDNTADVDTSRKKLQNYYLFNAEEEGNLQFKLLLTRKDKETLINLLKNTPQQETHSPRIIENYQFFRNKITSENIIDVYTGLQRLYIVDVALERDKDNPQLIFESLNSTGLDLSQADLIRNYVLMGQKKDMQITLYENYWYPMESSFGNEYSSYFDWFIRDYLIVKTGQIPKIGNVYEAYKSYVQDKNAPDTVEKVVADIYKFSGFYVNMTLHKESDSELLKAFKDISRLKIDVSYPFLLAVYNDYANETISINEFREIVRLVEYYVFRRAICGIPTNSLNKTFATLYKSIKKENYLESIKATFQLMDGYKRFPTDNEFKREIVSKDVYNFRSRNYLLSNLENLNRKEKVNIEDYTIEHILPQNQNLSQRWQSELGENWKIIQEKYLHTIGNLTLTGYNSELSDRPFLEKKTMEGGFNESPIRLNKGLANVDEWNEEAIKARATEIAEKAAKIWVAPNLPEEILEKYKETEETKETKEYTIDQYKYLADEMLELYHALRKRILNLDPLVREEYKKLYIAYKTASNFIDIVPQKNRLRLSLNIEFNFMNDPKGLCKDVSGLGRWGNGDVEVGISSIAELEDVMYLIQQSFDAQMELV